MKALLLVLNAAVLLSGLVCTACPAGVQQAVVTFIDAQWGPSSCYPKTSNAVAQAVYKCFLQLRIRVDGCNMSVTNWGGAHLNPAMPCRYFGIVGNLTGDGSAANVWAYVDEKQLVSYFRSNPADVEALAGKTPELLADAVVAFMQVFFSDQQVNVTLPGSPATQSAASQAQAIVLARRALRAAGHAEGAAYAMSRSGSLSDTPSTEHANDNDGCEEDSSAAQAHSGLGSGILLFPLDTAQMQPEEEEEALLKGSDVTFGSGGLSRRKHTASYLYRNSARKVILRTPRACKYKYRIDQRSNVLVPDHKSQAAEAWRAVYATVATLAVIFAVVGVGLCLHFSRVHSALLASQAEYEELKRQMLVDPTVYARFFPNHPLPADQQAPAGTTTAQQHSAGGAAPAASTAARAKQPYSLAAQQRQQAAAAAAGSGGGAGGAAGGAEGPSSSNTHTPASDMTVATAAPAEQGQLTGASGAAAV